MENNLEFLKNNLPVEERLCALAEEASELAQAALKLRRVYDQTSPTIVTYEEAVGNLHEEIADVMTCVRVLGLDSERNVRLQGQISQEKMQRWVKRISGRSV